MEYILKVGLHYGPVGESGVYYTGCTSGSTYGMKMVHWIKDLREDVYGMGLRDAKQLADHLRAECERAGRFIGMTVIVSDRDFPQLASTRLAGNVNPTSSIIERLDNQGSRPFLEPQSYGVLRATARELIDLSSYSEAIEVLHILRTMEEDRVQSR